MIHGRQLRVVDKFASYVRPDWDDKVATTDKTIEWHAEQKKITKQEFIDILNKAPTIDTVWPKFTAWVDKYNWAKGNKTGFCSPISAGYNIVGFDNIITARHCLLYGPKEKDKRNDEDRQRLFSDVYAIDIMQHMWYWFENNSDLKNLQLPTLLEYMGASTKELEGAHNATFDAGMCSQILVRLLKTSRYMTSWNEELQKRRLEFKNCFKEKRT